MHNNSKFTTFFNKIFKEGPFTQSEIAEKIGVSQSLVSSYLKGFKHPKFDKIVKIANLYDSPVSNFIDYADMNDLEAFHTTAVNLIGFPEGQPVYGYATAGSLEHQEEHILGYVKVPEKYANKDNYMAVKVSGDSMDKHLPDGAIAVFNLRSETLHNKIVLIIVDGKTTIKRLVEQKDYILLKPESTNSNHEPIILKKEEIEEGRVYGTLAWYCVDIEDRKTGK